MSISGLINNIKRAGFYIPFTLYFVLFGTAAILARNWIQHDFQESNSVFPDILSLLLTIALLFTATIIGFALLSVLVSYVFFALNRRKPHFTCEIQADLKESELNQKQTIRLLIRPLLKPLFGFIKIRLQYDRDHFSSKFSLLENKNRSFFNTTVEGVYYWPLPEIKEYHIESAVLYFEDIFHFFSIAVNTRVNSKFFTHPTAKNINQLRVAPRKTEETNNRIEELRKVEGEYLNYKNFEGNDDVRRIVWKIYARNKELVVRIPEIMDPYASHIYLYASFYSQLDVQGNNVAEVRFLNYFKVLTWSVYKNMAEQGFEVRFIPDQHSNRNNIHDEETAVKYSISTSKWQNHNDLLSYCKTSDAAVIVVSSFSDAAQVQEIIEQHGSEIRFIFIKLTESLQKHNMLDWVKWLFVQSEKDDLEVFKTNWRISPLRLKVVQNEKKLEEMIKKYQMAEI